MSEPAASGLAPVAAAAGEADGSALDGLDSGVFDLSFDDDSFVTSLSCLGDDAHAAC